MGQRREPDFFEKPQNIRRLWILLYAVCGLTVVAELFMRREPHFGFDRVFGFYALMGFISCAALILIAKALGYILKRKEDYYD